MLFVAHLPLMAKEHWGNGVHEECSDNSPLQQQESTYTVSQI